MTNAKRLPTWSLLTGMLTVLTIVAVGDAAAAGLRYTSGEIRFVTSGSEPRIVITLDTNPAILEPTPPAMDFQAQRDFQQRMMAFADWDDPSIEISIGLVDYGFGGSITDAMISKGRGVSFDAGYYAASNKISHIGLVIISEFSEDVIEAEFSAQLFSTGKPKQPKPEGAVSGWFRISLPGLHDPRIDHELSEGEQVRLNAAVLWDTARGTGITLEDIDRLGGGGGGGAGGGGVGAGSAANSPPSCDCSCAAVVLLPDFHHCIVPGAACFAQWQSCGAGTPALQAVPASKDAVLEALLDIMGAADAPPETRDIMRQSFEELSPEELVQMLQTFRQAADQQ